MAPTQTLLGEYPKWEAPGIDRPTPLPDALIHTEGFQKLFDAKGFANLLANVRDGQFTMEKCWMSSAELRAPLREDFSGISAKEFPELRDLGWEAVKKGLVGTIILAGGTSSRLKENKIFLEVSPGKSLLYIKYMTTRGISEKRGLAIPLCVMTSPFTTPLVLEDLGNHGIRAGKDYLLFEQPVAPRVTERGELVTYQGQIQFDVTGHGAIFSAIRQSGVLTKFAQWGVRILIQSNTDNPFVFLDADENNPLWAYIGHHLKNRSRITAQISRKEPTQRGGVPLWVRTSDDRERLAIVEESQMDPNFYKEIHYKLPFFNPLTLIYDVDALKGFDSAKLPWVIIRRIENASQSPFHYYRFETFSGSITLSEETTFLPDTIPGIFESGMFTQLKNEEQLPAFQKAIQKRLASITNPKNFTSD